MNDETHIAMNIDQIRVRVGRVVRSNDHILVGGFKHAQLDANSRLDFRSSCCMIQIRKLCEVQVER